MHKNRQHLPFFDCLIIFLFLLSFVCISQGQSKLPNIVLIVADDLGYGDLSAYGCEDIKTPNIDNLAKKGVKFTQFYANGPECTPTRAALLTGRYQQRAGGLECAIGLGNVGRYKEALALSDAGKLGLPVDYSVLPKMLKEKNYNTALIGKWHLGNGADYQPLAHGFDFAMGPLGGSLDYFHHSEPKGTFIGIEMAGDHDFYRQGKAHHREGYYLTNLIADEAVAWLNIQKQEKPFFLYLPFTAPHTPYQAPADYRPEKTTSETWNKGKRETYIKMVENLDEGVGKIMAQLENSGFLENTLVIFFSDNGPTKAESTGPFRGHKGQVFEGGIRVPCIIQWPGKIQEGLLSQQSTISMDITAALASIVNYQPKQPFDGYDLINHVRLAKSDFPRNLFWRRKRGKVTNKAVRADHYKYIQNINGELTEEFLFDLKNDVGEEMNLIESRPEVRRRLSALLVEWEEEVVSERE